MTKEQKFYKALQDVFIGARIEGEGGFVNLMRIKSSYYRQIEDILKKDIETALSSYPAFRDELFDKLYSFFSRYFTESGSIYFNQTPFHNNIYEKIYTDEKDVILFWKTQMLYYVKTDRIFKSLPVEFDGFKIYFDASKIENKKANEKRSLVFELNDVKEDGTIVFGVLYSEKGTKTNQDEILKAIKRKGIAITEDQLERAFRVFEKQSEVDFFINKNAKAFLQEQFKLWSYQYFWEGAKEWSADRVNQLQNLKNIAFKIIDFISQFEDELVKIWNKPKFVKNSNYVITLDRIISQISEGKNQHLELIEKIFNHPNINEQIREWEELGIIEEKSIVKNKFSKFRGKELKLIDEIFENTLEGKRLKKEYVHLPIDTKYFKDLEFQILSQFNDLDKSLDGWLIKSENYQALNTILPKFKEKVQTIYIDPPFNLDSSDQFLYRTNYKDANWATLLENRLRIAKDWLNEKGSIFVRCDSNGNWIVRFLMNDVFDNNLKNEIAVKRTRTLKGERGRFHTAWESLYFYAKSENAIFNGFRKLKPESEWQWVEMHLPGTRKDEDLLYRNFFGKRLKAPEGRRWALSQDALDDAISKGLVKMDEQTGMPKFLTKWETLGSNWTDISGYSPAHGFTTENSEELLQRAIESTSNKNSLVLDFFLGSGTTTAVAHKLGRKWIGVEMGEHFYSVVLTRMKKVLAYDKSGISKEVKEYQGGGFFKYYELEQYEEALANCKYEDGDLFNAPGRSPYQEYVFMKDEKMLKALEIDYKKGKVKIDLSKLYPNIDIAETLSNLTGKWIRQIKSQNLKIKSVVFEDGNEIDIENLDYRLIKPLIWW
ncbi:MAG: site-specific DNA-methyltransferase [Candidatus Saccharicenans sp.]|nr:site-specific DNA-methyltransferase [Candidatus Saccharicenans sp.]MDI6848876.1 site-specific DNA-methyltransferase [Candidatus Saccharicenans sp.]